MNRHFIAGGSLFGGCQYGACNFYDFFLINRFHMIRSYMKAPFGTNGGFWNLWILGEF